jgi:hypothetical protein
MMQLGQRAERSPDFGGIRTASDPEALIKITHTSRLCLKWTLTSVVHVLFWDRVGTSATSKRFAVDMGHEVGLACRSPSFSGPANSQQSRDDRTLIHTPLRPISSKQGHASCSRKSDRAPVPFDSDHVNVPQHAARLRWVILQSGPLLVMSAMENHRKL